MPPSLARDIAAIAADNRSGAMALARRALMALRADTPETPESARETAAALESAQPAMAPFANIAEQLRRTPIDTLPQLCESLLERLDRSPALIARHAAPLFTPSTVVLTHSSSDTVAAVLEAHRPSRIILTESRPVREGIHLARRLAAHHLAVDLIADAAAARVISEATLVLAGADSLSPAGLVNKIGTHLIALAAREYGVPVWAVLSGFKIVRAPLPDEPSHDPAELADLPDCRVRNYYFETTPVHLLAGVVTDEGLFPKESLAGYLGR